MPTARLAESFAAPLSGSRVDRDAGVVRDVLVCGTTSANGRSYPWGKGLTCDPALYEGRPVNCDHGKTATVDRRLGWLENVRISADGRPRADLHVLRSHPMADRILEAAERNPSLFGLSHVAVARTRMDRGTEVIEAIQSVESVDIVADPATTKSLYESAITMPTLRTFLESVGKVKPAALKWSRAKWVREMDESGAPMDLPPPPAPDATEPDADEATTAAFKAAISAVVDKAMSGGMDPKEALTKIKTLLRSHGDINGDGTVDAADVDAADDTAADLPPDELAKAESKGVQKGKDLIYEAIKTATSVGLPADRETLELIADFPAERIAAVAKRLTESKPAEKPRTTGRTTQVAESKQTPNTPQAASVVGEFRRP